MPLKQPVKICLQIAHTQPLLTCSRPHAAAVLSYLNIKREHYGLHRAEAFAAVSAGVFLLCRGTRMHLTAM